MSKNPNNYRQERIERLLEELRYEVTRGMMDREIDETLNFSFIVPASSTVEGGMVRCTFQTRPGLDLYATSDELNARLKVVK